MKTLLRNFISIMRRFKVAMTLNMLGLSAAFAAFIIIIMQLQYDCTFDRSVKQADCIFRVDVVDPERGQMAIMSRPFAEAFTQSSPHILAGMICDIRREEAFFTIEREGKILNYQEVSHKVSPGFADVFGPEMVEGDAHALDVRNQGLIPESLARKFFGNQSAIGQCLQMEEDCLIVGGVYRDFPENSSMGNCIYYSMGNENRHSWNNMNYSFYIRVDRPENAAGLIENFKEKNKEAMAVLWNGSDDFSVLRLEPLNGLHFRGQILYDSIPKTSWQTVWVLMAIAVIIVMIAGINYTNFSTSLTPMRIKSINTQKILGSPTKEIRMLLMLEAMLVALLSYGLSLIWVELAGKSFLAELVSADMALMNHLYLLGGTALLALLTGLLAGIYPSYYMTSFQPALVLKGSFGLSPAGRKLRSLLISIQFVSSFALIIGALFMFLQNRYMRNSSLGYDRDQLIVCPIAGSQARESYQSLRQQLLNFSGIEEVTYAGNILSSQDQYMNWGRGFKGEEISFQVLPVEANFLQVMGIDVTEGRDFREADHLSTAGVYIFNESARQKYQMELDDMIDDSPIVGFMPDVKFASFRMEVTPMCFYVLGKTMFGNPCEVWFWNNYLYVQVKAGSDMFAAMEYVEKTLQTFDKEYPFHVRFFDEVLDSVYRNETNMGKLITLFSLVAVFISIVGVFGLVMFDSEYRKKEIGIRRVMGASIIEILMMFNSIYLRIMLICFVIATPLAWYGVSRWLENFAYKTPMYLWVYGVAFLLVSIVTLLTVTFQNWHTATANPVDSIKNE